MAQFEARNQSADLWKKVVDAVKDLVSEGNIQCTPEGLTLQAMDTAHVALVSLNLTKKAFQVYHMEGNRALGINMQNFAKILKTIDAKDALTLRHNDNENTLSICAEDGEASRRGKKANTAGAADVATRSSEYNMKLMEIEAEEMGVPDIEYKCSITMATSEFARICRDMNVLGDTITLSINKEGVVFSAEGDLGGGKHVYKCPVTVQRANYGIDSAVEIKQEIKQEVKREVKDEFFGDGDDEDDDGEDNVPLVNRLKNNNKGGDDDGKKKKKGDDEDDDKKERVEMSATMSEPVELSFALRYFTIFSKASNLSPKVTLSLSSEHPCQVEYTLEGTGHLRFFLAPKVEAGE